MTASSRMTSTDRDAKIAAMTSEIRIHSASIETLIQSGQTCPDASRALQRKKDNLAIFKRNFPRWPRLSLNFSGKHPTYSTQPARL